MTGVEVMDDFVLDLTQGWHDQIDGVVGKSLEVRATLGGVLEREAREVLTRNLSLEQREEMRGVRLRIFTELLHCSVEVAERMLER